MSFSQRMSDYYLWKTKDLDLVTTVFINLSFNHEVLSTFNGGYEVKSILFNV